MANQFCLSVFFVSNDRLVLTPRSQSSYSFICRTNSCPPHLNCVVSHDDDSLRDWELDDKKKTSEKSTS